MPVMNMFPGGSTLQIPLDAPTSFSAAAGNAQVELTWTDPLDKYATPEGEVSETGDQLVSEWDHTVLVRKTGSQPAGPNDGTVVVSSSVRNQYQSTAYVDSGLTNDTTYYYGVFAYNKDGVASSGAFVNATPKAGTPLSELAEGTIIKINENGSPVEFYLAKHNYEPDLNGQGRELVVRKNSPRKSDWSSTYALYTGSLIYQWCNGSYLNRFSTAVKGAIGTTRFYAQTDANNWRTVGVVEAAAFSLSVQEVGAPIQSGETYVPLTIGSTLPIAETLRTTLGAPWWTRQFNNELAYGQAPWQVVDDGEADAVRIDFSRAIVPAITLPSDAYVDNQLNLKEDML